MAKTYKDERRKNLGSKKDFKKAVKMERIKRKNKRSVSCYRFVEGQA